MRHSTVRVLTKDEPITVLDVEALDFMVVVTGSLSLEYDCTVGGVDAESGTKILEAQGYIYPVRNAESEHLRVVRVAEGCEECILMVIQRLQFRTIISTVGEPDRDYSIGPVREGESDKRLDPERGAGNGLFLVCAKKEGARHV